MQVGGLPGANVTDVAVALQQGSHDALAYAYETWGALIYTTAMRELRDHHDAEDVTQQVFVSAWRSRHTLRPGPSALPGWLVGIAKHRIADQRTARFRSIRNTAAVAATTVAEHEEPADRATVDRLYLAHELDRLGEPRASVVRMALVEQRTHEDISRELGIPVNTVKSHVRRALIHLRQRLTEVNDVAP